MSRCPSLLHLIGLYRTGIGRRPVLPDGLWTSISTYLTSVHRDDPNAVTFGFGAKIHIGGSWKIMGPRDALLFTQLAVAQCSLPALRTPATLGRGRRAVPVSRQCHFACPGTARKRNGEESWHRIPRAWQGACETGILAPEPEWQGLGAETWLCEPCYQQALRMLRSARRHTASAAEAASSHEVVAESPPAHAVGVKRSAASRDSAAARHRLMQRTDARPVHVGGSSGSGHASLRSLHEGA